MTMKVERSTPSYANSGAGYESAPFPNPHPAVKLYAQRMGTPNRGDGQGDQGGGNAGSEQGEPRPEAKRRRFSIDAEVLGIPETDLTPPVEAALSSLAQKVDQLSRHLSDLTSHQRELEHQLNHDEWTGLPNRRAFMVALSNELTVLHGEHHSLIFVEIENLAEINLAHGHLIGDEALKRVAERLRGMVAHPDLLGYLGSNEFVILMHRVEEPMAQQRAADMARRLSEQPLWLGDGVPAPTVRLGYGVHEVVAGESAVDSVIAADRMMRVWKQNAISRLRPHTDTPWMGDLS